VRCSKASFTLAPIVALATSLSGPEAKAIALIDNPFINTIGCNSRLLLGTTKDVTSIGMAGYVFKTGPTGYNLDAAIIPLANGVFGGSYIGNPTTAVVSLYKVDSNNQLIGGPVATTSQAFQITNQEECRVSTVNLAGFQVAANERYFLGIGTVDSMLWSTWPNRDVISTNGGIEIQDNGLRGYGFNLPATASQVFPSYYGNIQLSGTAIPAVPAPIPALGLAAMLGCSRNLRKRIKAARLQSSKN